MGDTKDCHPGRSIGLDERHLGYDGHAEALRRRVQGHEEPEDGRTDPDPQKGGLAKILRLLLCVWPKAGWSSCPWSPMPTAPNPPG